MSWLDRRVVVSSAAALVSEVLLGCRYDPTFWESEHLLARPGEVLGQGPTGLMSLPVGGSSGLLYVPNGLAPSRPLALLVLLHGAGGSPQTWFGGFGAIADAANLIIVAPKSSGKVWDTSRGRAFRDDARFIDRALEGVFERYAVDAKRLAVGGFSDGGSYALSLGLANGDLFSQVIAFSPGYFAPSPPRGRPRIFVSHGTEDRILPIDSTTRELVPRFRREGYDVTAVEFDGGHEVPRGVTRKAFEWLLAGWNPPATPSR